MNSNNDCSSYFEQNHSFIVNKIRQRNKNDEDVPEFFDLLQYENKEYIDDRYDQPKNSNDIAVLNKCNPYPESVMKAALSAKERVEFGTFIQIEHYSCKVDNKLYIWPMNKSITNTPNQKSDEDSNIIKIEDKCEQITCVCCGSSDQSVHKDRITHVIVVASNRNIIIYPVTNQNEILTDYSFRTSLRMFIVTSMVISDKGKIFLGSDIGDIFLVYYSRNKYNEEKYDIVIKNLTQFPFISFFKRLITFANIIQLSLCQLQNDSILIASLDTKYRIKFYQFFGKDDNCKLTEIPDSLFKIEDSKKHQKFEKIIKIASVPISDSSSTRFIAFTENSDRLFFEADIDENDIVENTQLYQVRHAAFQISKDKLIDASYSLGVTVFMYRNQLAIMRTAQSAHIKDIKPTELISLYKFNHSNNLIFTRGGHIFSNHKFKIFNNEMVWQHLINPSQGYLMTSCGVHIINFSIPVDRLSQIMNESHGHFTSNVIDWMNEFRLKNESSACALLLASQKAQSERSNELFVLYRYTNEMIKREYEIPILGTSNSTSKSQNSLYDNSNRFTNQKQIDFDETKKMPESCEAFVMRAARLMKPIWDSPIFQTIHKNDQEFVRINEIYGQLPSNFLSSLKILIDLAEEYLRIKSTNEKKEEGIYLHEKKILKKFISYMRTVNETITFIQILEEQEKTGNEDDYNDNNRFQLITSAMKIIKEESEENRNTLMSLSIGNSNQSLQQSENTLFELLHDFAASLFKTRNDLKSLAQRFYDQCPDFYNEDDSRIYDALDSIENAKTKEKFKEAKETFSKYSKRPLKLYRICKAFEKFYYYEGIVEVCQSRASSLDPDKIALNWYKRGCDPTDLKGTEAFDKCYRCYEHIFNVNDLYKAFKYLLETNDELFNICLYQYIIYDRKDKELLMRLFSSKSQHLEIYLKEKAPHHLWKFQARQKKYDLAARSLLEIVKDKDDCSFKFIKKEKIGQNGSANGANNINSNNNNDNNNDNNYDDDDDDDDDDNFVGNKIPNLRRRATYLLKVISYARGCGEMLLLDEAQRLYRLANIQINYNERVLKYDKETGQSTFNGQKHYILDQQTLFNMCSERGYWDLILKLFSFCAINTSNKELSISRVWTNFFIENIGNLGPQDAQHVIVTLINNINNNPYLRGTGKGTRIEAINDVLNVSIVLPLLENFKYKSRSPIMWACQTLLKCGINPESLFMQYIKMIEKNKRIEFDKKADFVFIAAKIVNQNFANANREHWEINLFKNGMNWFIKKATGVSYYSECFNIISEIKSIFKITDEPANTP